MTSWGTVALGLYLSLTIIFLILLSIKTHLTSEWENKKSYFMAVWRMRAVYGSILVHLYDTSTDIGVLVSWVILAYNENSGNEEYANVDMLSLAISMGCTILIYRIAFLSLYLRMFKNEANVYSHYDIFLILIDMYIIRLVCQTFGARFITPCKFQRSLSFYESIFESMPQLILQTLFLVRTYNTTLAANDVMLLSFLSISASLFSIVNNFIHEDHCFLTAEAQAINCSLKKCPCISVSYVFWFIWRFAEIIVRFIIFTLIWAVVGGFFLPLYLLGSCGIYFYIAYYRDMFCWVPKNTVDRITFVLQAVIAIPLRNNLYLNIIRFVDNCVSLCVVSAFAVFKFQCVLCSDEDVRNMMYNEYIFYMIFIAGFAAVLEFCIYLGLYFNKHISEGQFNANLQIVDFNMDGITDRGKRLLEIHPCFMDTVITKMNTDEIGVEVQPVASMSVNSK